MFIPYTKPFVDPVIIGKSFFGDKVNAIQETFGKLLSKSYALFTADCRTALYLAFSAIEPKGEIITTPLACEAAITPIIAAGHRPKFIDIDDKTGNFNLNLLEKYIDESTVGILVVHLGGVPAPIAEISRIAKHNKLIVVEDCAHAFGSTDVNNIPLGTSGDISCLNFYKGLFGMGGMLLTNNQSIFENALAIHNDFPLRDKKIIPFRLIRNFLQKLIRSQHSYNRYYKFMNKAENLSQRTNENENDYYNAPYRNLVRPLPYEANHTWNMFNKHWHRNKAGRVRGYENYAKELRKSNSLEFLGNPLHNNPLTRIYLKTPYRANELIDNLVVERNIECKHLSQDYRNPYQHFLGDIQYFRKNAIWTDCPVTKKLNDQLLSVPFYPSISDQEIGFIINEISSS